jgi:YidC/Oxa1 family membrane protein insertase
VSAVPILLTRETKYAKDIFLVDDDSQSRLLMALVLSMLVIFLFMKFNPPQPPPQRTQQDEQQTSETTDATSQVPGTGGQVASPVVEPGTVSARAVNEEELGQAKDIVVETALVRATFTTLGGRLKSLQTKEYPTKTGEPVDLVPPTKLSPTARLPLGVVIQGPTIKDNPDAYLFEAREDPTSVTFERLLDCGLRMSKSFKFEDDSYVVKTSISFRNETGDVVYVGQDEQPAYLLAWEPGLEDPALRGNGRYGGGMGAVWLGENLKFNDKSRKPTEFEAFDAQWGGIKSQYFAAVIRPEVVPATVKGTIFGEKGIDGQRVVVAAPSFRLEPNEVRTDQYELFMGPLKLGMLRDLGHEYKRLVSFGMFRPVSEVMLWLLRTSYRIIPNYGIAIILLTILVRGLLYPLNRKSFKSMKAMQALRPAMQEIEQKYKDKPQERAKKMMELQKEHGVSMFGGCMPMFAQFPIWIALFRTLQNSIELRGAKFMFWINDLSSPETVYTMPFKLPVLGNDAGTTEVHLLPLVMACIMLVQQKMMPMATGPQADSQKMMMIMMPVMMGVLFYHMPSGLCLYILVSTLLGIGQQHLVHRGMDSEKKDGKAEAKSG